MKRLALLAVAAAVAVAPASAAGPYQVDLVKAFKPKLAAVKAKTTVPVLYPPKLALLDPLKSYVTAFGTKNQFGFEIDAAPGCHGANACFVATFAGKRGGKLPGRPNVRLASGDPAIFRLFSCGGSCSPSSFWFTHRGVLYSWQVKDLPKGERAVMIGMANEALAAGPR